MAAEDDLAAAQIAHGLRDMGVTATSGKFTPDDYPRSLENIQRVAEVAQQFHLKVAAEFVRNSTFLASPPTALRLHREAAHRGPLEEAVSPVVLRHGHVHRERAAPALAPQAQVLVARQVDERVSKLHLYERRRCPGRRIHRDDELCGERAIEERAQ